MVSEIDGERTDEWLCEQKSKEDRDAKGKRIMSDQTDMLGINSENCVAVSRSFNQEKLDEM